MSDFNRLQTSFVAQELSAFGLSGQDAEILQPPAALSAVDDAALWAWFDVIPEGGTVYAPSGSDFFTAYSAVIDALVAGASPLDPVAAAKKRLAQWGTAPPSWTVGALGMASALASAPSLAFTFNAVPANAADFWGLVGGAVPPALEPSEVFASGTVRAEIACAHLLAFAPLPGDWYVSSALSLAYRSPDKAPWDPASSVTWDTTFGPRGSMRRIMSALIVASGVEATVTSTACFDEASQTLIEAGAATRGAWPYYLPASAGATKPVFDADGSLRLTIKSNAKTAIALAAMVRTASSYLGGSS